MYILTYIHIYVCVGLVNYFKLFLIKTIKIHQFRTNTIQNEEWRIFTLINKFNSRLASVYMKKKKQKKKHKKENRVRVPIKLLRILEMQKKKTKIIFFLLFKNEKRF